MNKFFRSVAEGCRDNQFTNPGFQCEEWSVGHLFGEAFYCNCLRPLKEIKGLYRQITGKAYSQ